MTTMRLSCTLYGLEAEVEYDYDAGEDPTEECPGCPSEVLIQTVKIAGHFVSMDDMTVDEQDHLQSLCEQDAEEQARSAGEP